MRCAPSAGRQSCIEQASVHFCTMSAANRLEEKPSSSCWTNCFLSPSDCQRSDRRVGAPSYGTVAASISRPLLPTTFTQRHTERPCLLICRSHGPLKFPRDHRCLRLFSRERLQGPHVFLRPRLEFLNCLLRHFCSPCASGSVVTLPSYPQQSPQNKAGVLSPAVIALTPCLPPPNPKPRSFPSRSP
jgi:hypothetical protein